MLDVHEKDGVVTHLCDRALSVGAEVGGHIDWARRFDHMQQHSGEHIISGLLCSTFHCDNVGFHMGADVVTIDYNAPITWEQALEVERRANAVHLGATTPCRSLVSLAGGAGRPALPQQKGAWTGPVRIDRVPLRRTCAPAAAPTWPGSGQVGLVKLFELSEVPGRRAAGAAVRTAVRWTICSASWEQARQIGQALSGKAPERRSRRRPYAGGAAGSEGKGCPSGGGRLRPHGRAIP